MAKNKSELIQDVFWKEQNEGYSYDQIARRWGVSVRFVREVLTGQVKQNNKSSVPRAERRRCKECGALLAKENKSDKCLACSFVYNPALIHDKRYSVREVSNMTGKSCEEIIEARYYDDDQFKE